MFYYHTTEYICQSRDGRVLSRDETEPKVELLTSKSKIKTKTKPSRSQDQS